MGGIRRKYTLVAVADYVLSHRKGPTVSNISSSRALKDVTEAHGCRYYASAVGEVNASTMMQQVNAVIGGEGNGGVIVPDFHYGRDALIGAALFLSHMAHKKLPASALRATYPDYFLSKNKIEISDPAVIDSLLEAVKKHYAAERITTIDGLRVDFDTEKCLLRKSTPTSLESTLRHQLKQLQKLLHKNYPYSLTRTRNVTTTTLPTTH